MKLYISVISHGHDHIIELLSVLPRLMQHAQIQVLLRDNVKSQRLQNYCNSIGLTYYSNQEPVGFAANNNLNYLQALELGLSDRDYFLLLNPDVELSEQSIDQLVRTLEQNRFPLIAPNLYLNKTYMISDYNLRRYPTLGKFFHNYLLSRQSSVIDKTRPTDKEIFWASGAFLIIRGDVYHSLNGLDDGYFMYCEDVDFCYRALQEGIKITYLPEIVATHYRRNASRRFGTRLFFHHVKSAFIYELTRLELRKSWHKKDNSMTVALNSRALTGDKKALDSVDA